MDRICDAHPYRDHRRHLLPGRPAAHSSRRTISTKPRGTRPLGSAACQLLVVLATAAATTAASTPPLLHVRWPLLRRRQRQAGDACRQATRHEVVVANG